MAKKVRTPEGAEKYNKPIGSPIGGGAMKKIAAKARLTLTGDDTPASSSKTSGPTPPKPAAQPKPATTELSRSRPRKVRAKGKYDPAKPLTKVNSGHPTIGDYDLAIYNKATASANRRRLQAITRSNYSANDDEKAKAAYLHARIKETESPAKFAENEAAEKKWHADRQAGWDAERKRSDAEREATERRRQSERLAAQSKKMTSGHPTLSDSELATYNKSTPSANRRRLERITRSEYSPSDDDKAKATYLRARIREKETPEKWAENEAAEKKWHADRKAGWDAEWAAGEPARQKRREADAALSNDYSTSRESFRPSSMSADALTKKLESLRAAQARIKERGGVYSAEAVESLENMIFRGERAQQKAKRRARSRARARRAASGK